MGRLLMLLVIVDLLVIAIAMADCLATPRGAARVLPRGLWILLILLGSPVGAVAWLTLGRPGAPLRPRAPARAPGPDDDTEFLRDLARRPSRPQDDDLLRRYEREFDQPERPEPGPTPRDDGDRRGDPTET
jgi:hypothetical protein